MFYLDNLERLYKTTLIKLLLDWNFLIVGFKKRKAKRLD